MGKNAHFLQLVYAQITKKTKKKISVLSFFFANLLKA